MSRTRIAFVTHTTGYGGLERYLMHLASRLDPSSVETIIVNSGLDCYTPRLHQRDDAAVTIRLVPISLGFFSWWRLFRRLRPDVIVFVKGQPLLFPWYAYLAATLSGAKRVHAIEQFVPEPPPHRSCRGGRVITWLRDIAGCRARYLLRMKLQSLLCDTTICGADIVRQKLVNDCQYLPGRTLTVRNGVDLQFYSPLKGGSGSLRAALGIRDHERVLVCTSRMVKRKAMDVLLEALAEVSTNDNSWKCIIAGDGPLEAELRLQASELGLRSSVLFVGHQEDVRPYLLAADIFVYATHNDCLPGSLLEAMACGLPCIAGAIDGKSELIVHGESGLLVTPGSVKGLAEAITHLLTDKEERDRISINARRRSEDFDLNDTMQRVTQIVLNVNAGLLEALSSPTRVSDTAQRA